MTDNNELKPTLLESSIDEMEFMIKGAREGYLTNQWICSFIGRPFFGMQLWRTSRMGMEIKGEMAPDLIEGLEAFVHEIETSIPVYKLMIKNLAERMDNEQ